MNQSRGVPDKPMDAYGCLRRRMEWKMVLKAALRSKRMRMDKSLESAVIRRSLVIFSGAVSALWWVRKPDWNCS